MRRAKIVFAALLCALIACSRAHVAQESSSAPSRLGVVFVPGFKGSMLKEKQSDRTLWILRRQALFNGDRLTLNASGLGFDQVPDLYASGLLDYIPIAPGFGLDPYRSFLEELRDRLGPTVPVRSVVYDWRQDNLQAVKLLSLEVDRLRSEGVEKIWLCAHSMGGLVTAYYLRYGTQEPEHAVETWEGARKVAGVTFAGVPFHGVMVIFHNLQFGSKTILNTTLLSPEAMGSFPSSYQLLPAPGDAGFVAGLQSQSLDSFEALDLYDPDHWIEGKWGLLKYPASDEQMLGERKRFVTENLKRAKTFWLRLGAPAKSAAPSGLKVINAIGTGHGTSARGIWFSDRQAFAFETGAKGAPGHFQYFEDGDYGVTASSARMVQAFAEIPGAQTLMTQEVHGNLFNDRPLREATMKAMYESQ